MRKRLISLFMLSLVSAVFMITILVAGYYSLAYRNLSQQNERDTYVSLEDAAGRIEKELKDNMESGNIIANYDDMIARFMRGDALERLSMRDSVRFLLSMQLELQTGLKYICVYPQDGSRMYVCSSAMQETQRTAAFEVTNRVLSDYDLRSVQKRIQITRCYNWRDRVFYAIVAPVYQTTGNRYLGSLVMLYDGENIQNLLPEKSKIKLLVVGDGEVLAATGEDARALWGEQGDTEMKTTTLSTVGWTICASPSMRELENAMSSLWRLCVVVFIGTGVTFSLLIAFQYRKIVGPVLSIAHQVAEIGEDQSREINLSFGVNEFDNLAGSINAMLLGQRRMSAEILRIKTSVYEEQISFLQSQINPHFLYNSLESIRGMAGRNMLGEVREAISGIAMIYRYCSKGGPFATLRDEYLCANNYANVINLCYQSAYQLRFTMDDALADIPLPRMILQPLIENAILHGFVGPRKDKGIIEIEARRETDALLLTVINDGVGVSPEQLTIWNSGWDAWTQNDRKRIGLTNVMKRVWLLYGDSAQVRFEEKATGTGLKITFKLSLEKSIMYNAGE